MSRELPVKVTVCQSILDKQNMETAMLSFGEMGVTDVIPVRTKQVYAVPKLEDGTRKVMRWQSCARAFVKNSLREVVPTVHAPVDFAEAVDMAKDYDVAILAYENEHDPLCTAKAVEVCKGAKNILLFIGPERGFAPEEVELARNAGVRVISLGKRIIRACNAGAIFMGMLVYALELEGV